MNIVLPIGKGRTSNEIDWNALYGEHIGAVFNFFRYRTGDDQLAQDLTATTFEKAWKRRSQFRGRKRRLSAGYTPLPAMSRQIFH